MRRDTLLSAFLIVALSLLAFAPAFSAGFIWDDDDYVTHNHNLSDVAGLARIWADPAATPQYYPLVHTTFWIEHHLWADWAPGYHATNILLHALGALALWRVLLALGLSPPISLLAAILWSVHPIQVESVAWITERKNTLSALFYLLTIASLLKWDALQPAIKDRPIDATQSSDRRAPPPPEGEVGGTPPGEGSPPSQLETRNSQLPPPPTLTPKPRHWPWYLLALLFFSCALTSKTVVATLPAAWLLVRWWRRGPLDLKRDILPMVPLLVAGAFMARITAHLELAQVGAAGPEWAFTPADRLLIAGRAVAFYLGKLALPINLSFIYPRWTLDPTAAWQWAFPVAAVALLVTLFALRNRWGKAPFVACAFFLGTLVPALGFFNIYPQRYSFVADHFQHLASIGPIALLAALLARWPVTARAAIVAILVVFSIHQSTVYQNLQTLWTDAADKNPTGWLPQLQLGFLEAEKAKTAPTPFQKQVHFQAALARMQRARELAPNVATPNWNLGVALDHLDRTDEARAAFEAALRCDPDFALALNSLGQLELAANHLDAAKDYFERALEKQSLPAAHANLAAVLFLQKDYAAAAAEYAAATSLDPTRADWRLSLARSVYQLALRTPQPRGGDLLATAAQHYEIAIGLGPQPPRAFLELGQILTLLNHPAQAHVLLEKAIALDPSLEPVARPFIDAEVAPHR